MTTDPTLAGREQIHAEIDRITYRNEDNGWTVLKVRNLDDQSIVTVTGSLPTCGEGEHLQLIGQWSSHSTYGKQFKAERAVPSALPPARPFFVIYLRALLRALAKKQQKESLVILDSRHLKCWMKIPVA